MDEVDAAISQAVEDGLRLAKRVGGRPLPLQPMEPMDRVGASTRFLPTAPTMYAVVTDPAAVENSDEPSYQPHVHGGCDPPALVPLQMQEIGIEAECLVDTAVLTVRGRWRLHCISSSRYCDCRLLLPMSDQGSVICVEFSVGKRSYANQVTRAAEKDNIEAYAKSEDGGFLKPELFFLTIPQVRGGSEISLKVSWSQKLLYENGNFSINVRFNFPEYVTPFAKMFSKRETIELSINSGTGKEIIIQSSSHALKEKMRQGGRLSFSYEADVENWSRKDFYFSYNVYSGDLFGGLLVQAPSVHDLDQREMFCLYLFPGSDNINKVFRKEVVFVVDISASMQGIPLEVVRSILPAALSELTLDDCFNILAFSEKIYSFSSSLERATKDIIERATQWMSKNFVAEGGTDISQPLDAAMSLLSNCQNAIPHIFLITDGSVEDERNICRLLQANAEGGVYMHPRISTFGIGSYCNHYFLRTLTSLSRGLYDAAYDSDRLADRLQRWLRRALSTIVANISVDMLDFRDSVEVHPILIPDISTGGLVIVSGRYKGKFPDSVKAKGTLFDMSSIQIDLKVQTMKILPLEKVIGKQEIDYLTAQAWFTESKQLEEKVIHKSIQNGISSEFTRLVMYQIETERHDSVKQTKKTGHWKHEDPPKSTIMLVRGVALGFGNIIATLENFPPGFGPPKQLENFAVHTKAVSCCRELCECCCCMCVIRTLSQLNDQFMIVMTQLCVALSCAACFECCANVCFDGD